MKTLRSRVESLEVWYDRQETITHLQEDVHALKRDIQAIYDHLDVTPIRGIQLKARDKS